MTEAITTQLAKIEALKVIARSAVMPYRDRRPRPSAIARELGVATLVEGSALLAGGRVRITAHLVDGASDRQLWAESYEGDLTDVLALQARVARAIAREIRARVTPEEERSLAATRPVSPAAYAEYLDGLSLRDAGAAAPSEPFLPLVRAMIERFDAAVALEPELGRGPRPARRGLPDAWRHVRRPRRAAAQLRAGAPERRAGARARSRGGERPTRDGEAAVPRRRRLGRGRAGVPRGAAPASRTRRTGGSASSHVRRALRRGVCPPLTPRSVTPTRRGSPTTSAALRLCAGTSTPRRLQLSELRQRFHGEPLAALLEAKVLSGRGRYAEAADLLERAPGGAPGQSGHLTPADALVRCRERRASRSWRGGRSASSKRAGDGPTSRPSSRSGTSRESRARRRGAPPRADYPCATLAAGRSTPT